MPSWAALLIWPVPVPYPEPRPFPLTVQKVCACPPSPPPSDARRGSLAGFPGCPRIVWSPCTSCVLCCAQNRMNSVSREGGLWGISRAAGQALTADPGSYRLVIKGLAGIPIWEATSSGKKVPLGRGLVPIAVPLLAAVELDPHLPRTPHLVVPAPSGLLGLLLLQRL